MLLAFILITGWLAVRYVPQLIVGLIATLLGIYLIRSSRMAAQALIGAGAAHRGKLDYDRKPSRSERRLMRRHLKLALRQTELASLLPGVMARARRIADGR